MGAENLSCVKSIETHARTFLPLDISAVEKIRKNDYVTGKFYCGVYNVF